jgi:hypothetical protein
LLLYSRYSRLVCALVAQCPTLLNPIRGLVCSCSSPISAVAALSKSPPSLPAVSRRHKYDLHLARHHPNRRRPRTRSHSDPDLGYRPSPRRKARTRGCSSFAATPTRRLRPQLVLSGMFHLNFLVLLLRPVLGFPCSHPCTPERHRLVRASPAFPAYHRLLYRLLYRRADYVSLPIRRHGPRPGRFLRSPRKPPQLFSPTPSTLRPSAQPNPPMSPKAWPDSGPHLYSPLDDSPHEKGFDLLLRVALSRPPAIPISRPPHRRKPAPRSRG